MYSVDLFDKDKTTEELLEQVRLSAIEGLNSKNPSASITPFAALLVKLSREASETAAKNLLVQKRMIILTVLIFIVSIAQLGSIFINKLQSLTSIPDTKNTTTKPEKIKNIASPTHK